MLMSAVYSDTVDCVSLSLSGDNANVCSVQWDCGLYVSITKWWQCQSLQFTVILWTMCLYH